MLVLRWQKHPQRAEEHLQKWPVATLGGAEPKLPSFPSAAGEQRRAQPASHTWTKNTVSL